MTLLRALGDVEVTSPAAGDPESEQVRGALEREISRPRRPRRRLRLPFGGRSIALIPAVVIMAGATTAVAATLALSQVNPTTLFQSSPSSTPGLGLPKQTAIPSTVRMIGTVHVPDVGAVQYWMADTAQHGLCQALRLPGGTWVGYKSADGSNSIPEPTCYPTRQQVVAAMMAAQGGKLRVGLNPMSVDENTASVTDSAGRSWDIYYGIVSAVGAVGVTDPTTGQTAPLIDGKYFAMVAQQPGSCAGCDDLRAINAAGDSLPADYGPVQDRDH
ncbi:MAG: hypothetical protein ACRDNS_19500 [Trebonia sp.]